MIVGEYIILRPLRVYLRLICGAREKKSRTTGGSSILLELKRLVVLACNLKVVQNAALTPRPERTAEKCPYARKGAKIGNERTPFT